MEITLIIVGGVIVLTVVAAVGDYLTKTRLARAEANPEVLAALERRVAQLEAKDADQEAKIARLENDVAFTTRLLEKKEPD